MDFDKICRLCITPGMNMNYPMNIFNESEFNRNVAKAMHEHIGQVRPKQFVQSAAFRVICEFYLPFGIGLPTNEPCITEATSAFMGGCQPTIELRKHKQTSYAQ